jgi:hypothetical protein
VTRAWSLAAVSATIVLSGALSGCGSDSAYVENGDESLFLKLPNDWVSYEESELYEEPLTTFGDALSTLDVIRLVEDNWVVGFGAEALSAPGDALSFAGNVPIGYAAVIRLEGPERESFDVVSQRSFGWPPLSTGVQLDPVAAYRDDPNGGVEVILYEEFDVSGRGHGTHVRAAFDGLGNDSIVRDVTVIADTATTELYVLSIGCYAQCFLTNSDEINDVVSSFTLEEQE